MWSFASAGGAAAQGTDAFTASVFASAGALTHQTAKGSEPIAEPDDITALAGRIYVGFQNGVGSQGEPSPTGNEDSTIVAFDSSGRPVAQWDVLGKCDGLTADPLTHRVIATVNEDGNSSLYVIDPDAGSTPVHYSYNEPLPSNGGTDAISIYHGAILISASAPGTTGAAAPQADYPAVYRVELNASTHVATVHGIFSDEAMATTANTGSQEGTALALALVDPDSNEVVPAGAAFMLTSQADQEQIYVSDAGAAGQKLSVLALSQSVDDTAWASDREGALYTADNANDRSTASAARSSRARRSSPSPRATPATRRRPARGPASRRTTSVRST
ncbi:MAG: hypothetical protein ACRDLP_13410 [Solirubrobacteraceae bacterium]